MKNYKSEKGGKGGGLKEGVTKREKFNPAECNPPESNVGRPRHDNGMISRKVHTPKP